MGYKLDIHFPEAPSGTFEVYEHNSTTVASVYEDYDCTDALSTSEKVLNARGRAVVYVKELVDVTVYDSAGATVKTYTDGARAELVEIVNSALTGTLSSGSQGAGGVTDLNSMVSSALLTFGGVDLKYLEATGGNARYLKDVLAERFLSVKDVKGAGGEVAQGAGGSDDYVALQAAIDRMVTRGGGVVLLPKGTFNASTGLTCTSAGIWLWGVGPTATKIQGTGAGVDLLTVTITGEANMVIRGIEFTHSSTSTGVAVNVTSGNGVKIEDCVAKLHRTGFKWATTALRGKLERSRVDSTDGNSAGVAVTLGAHGVAEDVIAAAATGTAFSLAGQYSSTRDCRVTSSTATGFTFGAADTIAYHCHADACTTGFSVGAVARSGPMYCTVGTNTTDYTTNASATNPIEIGNTFSTRTLNEYAGNYATKSRAPILTKYKAGVSGGAFTPDPRFPINIVYNTTTTGNVTINATSTTGLVEGQLMILIFQNDGLGGSWTPAMNAQYVCTVSAVNADNIEQVALVWSATASTWNQVITDTSLATGANIW